VADEVAESQTEQTEWNTQELQRDFEVLGFAMGYCVVIRKADGVKGSLAFDHMPRRYYGWTEDR
jgi:hypothetical protein